MKSCFPLVPYKFKVVALLVSHNAFITFFYNCPMLSQTSRVPSYFNNTGGTSKGIMTLILPLKIPKLLEQSVPAVSFTVLRHYHYKPICLAFTARNMFFPMSNQRSPQKISIPVATPT
jgi:hypothetical protein